jgi:PAS domain S-box-containing protein
MILLALTLALAPKPAAHEVAPPPRPAALGSAQAVRNLTPLQADARRPVRFTGVVTFYEPTHYYLFVQDATAGIFVQPDRAIPGLAHGDRVEVEGTTDRGRFSPCVRATAVRRLGPGAMPGRVPFDLSLEDSRWLDSQRVEVWAVVREASTWHAFCKLRIESDSGSADVLVPGVAHFEELRKLVGQAVHTRGVCAARVDDDRAVVPPPMVFVQAPGHITALRATQADADPPWLIQHLTRFSPTPHLGARRVKVAGVVVGFGADGAAFVQDSSGGVCVQPAAPHALAVGDAIEAVGSLRFNKARATLTEATVRALGRGELPEARPRAVADLADGRHFGTRAVVEATVVQVRRDDRLGCVVALVEGAHRFEVRLPGGVGPGELGQLPSATRVRVTGVVGYHTSVADGGGGFVLWAQAPDAATVLERPPGEPWWNSRRVQGVAGVAAVVGAVAVGWIALLRRQVRRQTAELRAHFEQERLLDARYRDLFESAGDAVWVTDKGGAIVAMNHAAELLFGVARDQILGQPMTAFLDPRDTDLIRSSKVRARGEPFEYTLLPKGRSPVSVEVTSRVLPDGGIQTIARNVTERKQLQERVQRVQTLDVVGRLAGGVAHDFNNLLTVINGNTELIQSLTPPGEPVRELADEVLAAGQRAANLTRQLLSISRPRFSAPCDLDLAATVAATTGLLGRLLGGQIDVAAEFAADTPWVRGDAGLIEQIVMNLSVNARDAMPRGGTLTIRTHRGPKGEAVLTVADTGVGMTAEVQARLFEPFFTTKEVGKGTGLGLATVYGATQALGGEIHWQSEPGRGTTFTIELQPAGRPTPTVDQGTPLPSANGAHPRPATVLVVEDDEAVRLLTRQLLERDGLQVVTAASGEMALSTYRVAARRPDLVLTDIRMPRMTGLELAERLRGEFPAARVVFMSGFTGDDPGLEDEMAAAGELIRKPFTADGLVAFVRRALRDTNVVGEVSASRSG